MSAKVRRVGAGVKRASCHVETFLPAAVMSTVIVGRLRRKRDDMWHVEEEEEEEF